jgi:hypothetical protein
MEHGRFVEPKIVAECRVAGRRVRRLGPDRWWCLFCEYRGYLIWADVLRPPEGGKVLYYCVTDGDEVRTGRSTFLAAAAALSFIDERESHWWHLSN